MKLEKENLTPSDRNRFIQVSRDREPNHLHIHGLYARVKATRILCICICVCFKCLCMSVSSCNIVEHGTDNPFIK